MVGGLFCVPHLGLIDKAISFGHGQSPSQALETTELTIRLISIP